MLIFTSDFINIIMSNAFIQISPDSSGKKVQVFENIVGGQTVEATAVTLVNASGVPVSGSSGLTVTPALGAGASALRVNSTVFESGKVIKNSAGTLISLQGYTNSSTDQYLLFFDSTTVPANGTTPVWFVPIVANSYFAIEVPLTGIPFTTGISVSNSTTIPTKTAGSNNIWFFAIIQ
jgi:hypothetical protein